MSLLPFADAVKLEASKKAYTKAYWYRLPLELGISKGCTESGSEWAIISSLLLLGSRRGGQPRRGPRLLAKEACPLIGSDSITAR